MFPLIIYEVIIKFLDIKSLKVFRLINREANQLSLPKLLRIHTLMDPNSHEYVDFLKKYGSFVKGLGILFYDNFIKLQKTGLVLSVAFPHVRSISVKFINSWYKQKYHLDEFCNELVNLEKLKHMSIKAKSTSFFVPELNPVIQKLESLYLDSFSQTAVLQDLDFCGLKRFAMPWSFYPSHIEEHLVSVGTIEEFVSCYCDGTNFSSILSRNRWSERFGLSIEDFAYYEFKFIKHSPRFDAVLQILQKTSQHNIEYHLWEATNRTLQIEVEELINLKGFIGHITVVIFEDPRTLFRDQPCLLGIPSLEINCADKIAFPLDKTFCAAKLSCSIKDEYIPDFLEWAVKCFPNLTHLYISNSIPLDLICLDENSFPNLTHFYSGVKQSEVFWLELSKSAPNLLFIHYNHCDSNIMEFESIKPQLQLKPHESILAGTRDVHDQTGFNKYL